MKHIKHILAVASLLLIVGCTARYTHDVYNVNNASVVTQSKHMTQEKVGKIIAASGNSLGWTMQEIRPGYIVATLHIRDHVAKANIYYNNNSYSIKYVSSKNLTRKGMIHKNYNGWVHNLDNAIKRNLSTAS